MKKDSGNKIVKAVIVIVVSQALMLAGMFLGDLFIGPFNSSGNDAIRFAGSYFSFIGIWILIIIFSLFRKSTRKSLVKLIPFHAGNKLKTVLGIGLPFGIGINLLVAIVAVLHKDIYLSFSSFNPLLLLLFIVCITVQGGAEELTYRFYLYQGIADIFPEVPIAPMIINAVAFAAVHLFNDGFNPLAFLNIALIGVLYSLIIYYFDSFWAVVVAHAGWNFCQNILLGLPNSGIVSVYSVFKLDGATAVNSFAYNVNFGIESTLLSAILVTIACLLIIVTGKIRKRKVKRMAD